MTNIILIADDEPWQRMWISQTLHNAGYTCRTATDGESVVEHALALEPDLIVMDVEMPVVNGITAAERLRILPNTRKLPILFVTGYSSTRELLSHAQIANAEWMLKPFHPDELLTRVRRLLSASAAAP